MKLSHLTLGALLLAASVSYAQENPKPKRQKTDTVKVQRKRPETGKKPASKGSATKVKKDTLRGKTPTHVISPDYCPPCGMG